MTCFVVYVGMSDVAIWIRVGGKFDESCKYVGGEYEMLLVKNNVTHGVLRKMIYELLNVDESVRKMELNFEIEHPVRHPYGVIDTRTFELYMHHT